MTALVSVADLAAELRGDEPPTLLDVRWSLTGPPGREQYAAGHLPGARFVDLDTDLADPPGERGRHPLPDPVRFGAAMRRAGVRASRPVVAYDAGDGAPAARAWWLLRHFGHPSPRTLDGGLRAWLAAGRPVTTAEPAPGDGDFTPGPGALAVVDAAGAARVAERGALLDARAAERYRGEQEPVDPVAGHIPGARSLPVADLVGEAGLRRPADIAARLVAAGVAQGTPVAAYCGSGVTAALLVLALGEAGVDAALYPGSWSEWVADPQRPVATG